MGNPLLCVTFKHRDLAAFGVDFKAIPSAFFYMGQATAVGDDGKMTTSIILNGRFMGVSV